MIGAGKDLVGRGVGARVAGPGDAVLDIRTRYQHAIEPTFRAAVEQATGRRVVSFVTVTKLDPTYALEFFRLEPRTSMELA